jgi:sn-glycerol 3-phosphate transport system substrate-binding protein
MKLTLVSTSVLALAALSGAAIAQSAEKIKFDYWYGLSGQLGDVVQATCDRFNESQTTYEINCVG